MNRWYHVTTVVEYGSDRVRLYLDGQQQSDDNDIVAFESAASPSTPTHNNAIGTEDNGNNFHFDGRIDELRLSVVPRSPAWVETEYRSTSDLLIVFGSEETR